MGEAKGGWKNLLLTLNKACHRILIENVQDKNLF
jgi:hypothetical protein